MEAGLGEEKGAKSALNKKFVNRPPADHAQPKESRISAGNAAKTKAIYLTLVNDEGDISYRPGLCHVRPGYHVTWYSHDWFELHFDDGSPFNKTDITGKPNETEDPGEFYLAEQIVGDHKNREKPYRYIVCFKHDGKEYRDGHCPTIVVGDPQRKK